MSRLFSSCIRSHKRKEDDGEKESTKSEVESRIVTPRSPKRRVPVKPRTRQFSLRHIAIDNSRKTRLAEQQAAEKAQPELNIFRALKIPLRNPPGPTLDPDPFVGIPEVFGVPANVELKNDLFQSFLEHKEAAMVLYYDPTEASSNQAKLRFQQAAKTTKRQNHAYVAVNCRQMLQTCFDQQVRTLPAFKLYSYGKFVGHYEYTLTSAADLKLYTETSPVADLPFRELQPPCAIQ